MLETGGVGGVAGDRNVNILMLHDCNAFENVVGAVNLDLCLFAGGVRNFSHDVEFVGVEIVIGFNIGEAVDTGDDESRIFAETVEDNTERSLSYFICGSCDADSTFGSCEGFVTCEEAEALCIIAEKHCCEVAVSETDLAVFGDGAGNGESLKTGADGFCSFSCGFAAFLQRESRTECICP